MVKHSLLHCWVMVLCAVSVAGCTPNYPPSTLTATVAISRDDVEFLTVIPNEGSSLSFSPKFVLYIPNGSTTALFSEPPTGRHIELEKHHYLSFVLDDGTIILYTDLRTVSPGAAATMYAIDPTAFTSQKVSFMPSNRLSDYLDGPIPLSSNLFVYDRRLFQVKNSRVTAGPSVNYYPALNEQKPIIIWKPDTVANPRGSLVCNPDSQSVQIDLDVGTTNSSNLNFAYAPGTMECLASLYDWVFVNANGAEDTYVFTSETLNPNKNILTLEVYDPEIKQHVSQLFKNRMTSFRTASRPEQTALRINDHLQATITEHHFSYAITNVATYVELNLYKDGVAAGTIVRTPTLQFVGFSDDTSKLYFVSNAGLEFVVIK